MSQNHFFLQHFHISPKQNQNPFSYLNMPRQDDWKRNKDRKEKDTVLRNTTNREKHDSEKCLKNSNTPPIVNLFSQSINIQIVVLLVTCATRYPGLCLTFEGQNNGLPKLSLTSLFFPMQSFTLKASSVSSLIFFLFFIFYLLASLSVHSYPFLNSFIKTICTLLSFLLFLFKTPCNVRFLLRLHSKASSDHSNSNPGLTKH